MQELKELESIGVDIGDDQRLKVALINICFDNLGGNALYGIVECFNSHYYCRICECKRDDCRKQVCENPVEFRQKSSYLSTISRATRKNGAIDLNVSKGIKRSCIFNELENFHIFDNLSVDVMHDVNEGVIPFYLKNFFGYSMRNGILDESKIIKNIRDFNYGILDNRNVPSKICLDKKNLNQNATQLYCLMVHCPFIFIEFYDQLVTVWEPMQSLLQLMQIIYSSSITESDILRLKLW